MMKNLRVQVTLITKFDLESTFNYHTQFSGGAARLSLVMDDSAYYPE